MSCVVNRMSSEKKSYSYDQIEYEMIGDFYFNGFDLQYKFFFTQEFREVSRLNQLLQA